MDFDLPASAFGEEIPTIDFKAELNKEQYAAVTAKPGPILILAGAGSGKTRTITYRVAYLLSKGVRPSEILLLTFTNKASKEMLTRVEELTGIEPRRFWGGTFHSIGHRLLRIHGESIGLSPRFSILDSSEAESILKDAVGRIDSAFFKDKSNPKAGPLSNIISLSRNTLSSITETLVNHFPQHQKLDEQIAAFAETYKKLKAEQQVLDYDDLLAFWLELIESKPEIAATYRERFKHTLVDEYQDTNILQARIVDAMAHDHQILAVGDDAQCIYSWRGANFQNIINFEERHPNTQIYRIETNYRSSPEILELANTVISHRPSGQGFEKELRPHRESQGTPYFIPANDAREQAQFVIARVKSLIEEGRDPKEIAILYRAHYQALDMQMELGRSGIDYQITSGVRFFEQAHIKDIVAHIRFIYNPSDRISFSRLASLLPKVGEKSAYKIYDYAKTIAKEKNIHLVDAMLLEEVFKKVPKGAKPEWPSFIATLHSMKDMLDTNRPDEIVEIAIQGWYEQYLQGAYANFHSRMDDLQSLVGFASRYEDMHELIAQITLLNSEIADRSLEDQDTSIRLTTVHQAKGLEFDVVFLIGLADGLFPIRRAIEAGDTEEERRLFYVAVTRARDELYLSYPRMGGRQGPTLYMNPSRFIQEIPTHLYEPLRLRRSYGW